MGRIPKKAKVIFEGLINMSNGEKLDLKDQVIEVLLAPEEEKFWLCKFQGKEFTIGTEFLKEIEYEEIDTQR